jgi:hypothetical protein
MERLAQETFVEKRKIIEMQRQMAEDQEAEERYRRMCEKEEKIRKERRQKAIEVAEGFRQQREYKIMKKQQEKEEQIEDDLFLRQEYIRAEEAEKEIARRKKAEERMKMEQSMKENKEMEFFKKRKAEIEKKEDQKILEMFIKQMDEQDARAMASKKAKQDKLLARQSLIDAEAKRQAATKKVEEDFLEKQLEEQYKKEAEHIAALTAQKEKLQQERHRDMVEAMRLQRLQEQRKKTKVYFPDDSVDEATQDSFDRILKKLQNQKEIAAFQKKQAQEKREREQAEREREKLEYEAELEKDREDMYIAQEYARKLLAQYKDDEYA